MKRTTKQNLLALALIALAGVAVGASQNVTASATDEAKFTMTDGASIKRDADELGIRFKATMTKAYYEEKATTGAVVRVGAFVDNASNVEGYEWKLTGEVPATTVDVPVGIVDANTFGTETSFDYYSKIVYNKAKLKEESGKEGAEFEALLDEIVATEVVAQAYVSVTVDGTTNYYYATEPTTSRSMRAVAYSAKDVENFTETEIQDYIGTINTAVNDAYIEDYENYDEEAENATMDIDLSDDTYALVVGTRKYADIVVTEKVATLDKAFLASVQEMTNRGLGDTVPFVLFGTGNATPVTATFVTKVAESAEDFKLQTLDLDDEAKARYFAVKDYAGDITLQKGDFLVTADGTFEATEIRAGQTFGSLTIDVEKYQRASADRLEFSVNDGKFFGTTAFDRVTFTAGTQKAMTYSQTSSYGSSGSLTFSADIAETPLTIEPIMEDTVEIGKAIKGVVVANPQNVFKRYSETNKVSSMYDVVMSNDGGVRDVYPVELALETADSTYALTGVYAYTQIIDEKEDFDVFKLSTSKTTIDGYYVLGNDIDATDYNTQNTSLYQVVYSAALYSSYRGFRGIFNGRGYEIKNFTARDGGLFGRLNNKNGRTVVTNVKFTDVVVDATATRPAVLAVSSGGNTSNSGNEASALVNSVYVEYATTETNIASLITVPYNTFVTNSVIDYSKATGMTFAGSAVKTGIVFGTLMLNAEMTMLTYAPYQNLFVKGNGQNLPVAYCDHASANPYTKSDDGKNNDGIEDYLKVTANATVYAPETYGVKNYSTTETYGTADGDGRYTVTLYNVYDITGVTFEELPNKTLTLAYYFDFNEEGMFKLDDDGQIVWKGNA